MNKQEQFVQKVCELFTDKTISSDVKMKCILSVICAELTTTATSKEEVYILLKAVIKDITENLEYFNSEYPFFYDAMKEKHE
jgi:hypothetical protein